MPGEKSYKVKGEVFDIPESEVQSFLKDNPGAEEISSYTIGKDTLDIPVGEVNDFLTDNPGASPLKKKAETIPYPSISPSPLVSSSGVSGSGILPSGSSGLINYMTGENNPVTEPISPLNIPEQNSEDQLRSALTTLETSPVDQQNYNPEIQKTGLLAGEKTEALLRGTARLGNSIMKTPGFLYDIASSVTNNLINRPLGISDAPTSAQIGESIPDNFNAIKDVDKAIENSQKIVSDKYDKGISEYFSKGEYKKGFDLLSNSIVETAPTTIALMLGNAAGLSTAGSVGAGGAVFGAEKMSELEKNNPNISQEQKLMIASANGLLEGAFEQFGLTKLGGLAKNVLEKEGVDAAKKVAEEGFKSSYRKVLSRYMGISAEEALSEAATQFAQNAVDKYGGAKPDLDLREGVVDAAIIGLGAGASMSSPVTLAEVVKTKKGIKEAARLDEQRASLENDLQSESVTPEAKSAISEKIKDINEQEAVLAKEESDNFNSLTPEGRQQVNELLDKSKKIADAAVDESISDITRDILEKDIDAIDKEIDEVYKSSKAEPAKEDIVVEDNPQDEIDYLNEMQANGFPLTEEESARLNELVKPENNAVQNEIEQTVNENNQAVQNTKTSSVPEQSSMGDGNLEVYQEANKKQEIINGVEKGTEVQDSEPESKLEAIKKETPSKELIDEEEDIDAKDDDVVVQKMDTDIEAMKQMKTEDLAEKKFIGMIERAWKAKEEGKITKPTYTAFRNKAKDILAGKIKSKDSIESTEAKLKVTAALNKVKERLLGQDYKKITLSSVSPITPKTVADLIDLTNTIAHRGIDAGFTIAEATQKALNVIKKHPTYKKLVASKELNEKDFEKSFNEKDETKKEKPKADSSEKNDSDKSESKEKKNESTPEITKGKGQRRTAKRINQNSKFKEITDTITDEDYNLYDKVDQKKANQYIKDKISEYEKAGLIEELANNILEENSPFPEVLSGKAPLYLSDRIRVLAESEGNDFTKNTLNKLAGKLNAYAVKNITPAAQKVGLLSDINNTLPLSVEGIKEFAREKVSQTQDQNLTNDQKAELQEATRSLNEIMESEAVRKEIDKAVESQLVKLSEELKGKEWTSNAMETIDSLKIDLSDC